MDERGRDELQSSGCLDVLCCFRKDKCCITEDIVDDEKHLKYKGTRVPNRAGIYMCPRNVDGPTRDELGDKDGRIGVSSRDAVASDAPGPASSDGTNFLIEMYEGVGAWMKNVIPTRDELGDKDGRIGVSSRHAVASDAPGPASSDGTNFLIEMYEGVGAWMKNVIPTRDELGDKDGRIGVSSRHAVASDAPGPASSDGTNFLIEMYEGVGAWMKNVIPTRDELGDKDGRIGVSSRHAVPTREELLKNAERTSLPPHDALGQRRRKLARPRAAIIKQMREEKEAKKRNTAESCV